MPLTSSIPVLRVSDCPRAKALRTDVLSFTVGDEGGDPPKRGILHWDQAAVFADARQGPDAEPLPGRRAHPHLADAFAAAQDWPDTESPAHQKYRIRELDVIDPDGNRLCFGQDLGGEE